MFLLGKITLFCQWPCTVSPVVHCHLECHVECLPSSRSFFFFIFIMALELEISQLHQSSVLLQLPLLDMVIATDATSINWAFYFQGSEILVSCFGTWSCSMCKGHVALQEIQYLELMLHKMTFQLSGRWLPYICLTVLLKLIYYAFKVVQHLLFFSLSWLAFCILNQTNKHGFPLIAVYSPTTSQCWRWLLLGRLLPEWHLHPQIDEEVFHLWVQLKVYLLALCFFENPLPLTSLGLNTFNKPWTYYIMCFLLLHFFPNSGRKCHMSIQTLTLMAPCWMGTPWHVGKHSLLVSCCKKSHLECFSRLDAQGSAIPAQKAFWLFRYMCCVDKGSLP